MKKFTVAVMLISLLISFSSPSAAYASGIDLDGSFNDWDDKPFLADASGSSGPTDKLVRAGWYPDIRDGNLYLYAERLSGSEDGNGKPFTDWSFTVSFNGDLGERTASVYYHPPSNYVSVVFVDKNGAYLWSCKGKWGDGKDIGKKVEFMIPLEQLVSSTESGYRLGMVFLSGGTAIPSVGEITVSTISTFPYISIAAALIITALSVFAARTSVKRRCKK